MTDSASRRGARPPSIVAVLFVALVLVVLADVFALPYFVGKPAATTPPPTPTDAALLPTESPTQPPTPTLAPLPTATPTLIPVSTPTPTTPPTPTSIPTAPPTPQPTQPPTPQPTVRLTELRQRIEDSQFLGDYNGAGSGTYHGRTATWIYGAGTPYSTMTAQFQLDQTASATGRATLRIVGLEGSEPEKMPIKIVLNGATIYDGKDPLPNDFSTGPRGEGNWGTASFKFDTSTLKRNNELSISNLKQSDCTLCSDFVMIDYAVVIYDVITSN